MIPLKAVAGGLAVAVFTPQAVLSEDLHIVTTAWSQMVQFDLPEGFVPAYEQAQNGFYIMELVPKGETVDNWSQMITLTALQEQTGGGLGYANDLANQYQGACPQSYSFDQFDLPATEGATPAVAGYLRCGDLGGYSEAMVFFTFDGVADAYSLQWAERGPAVAGPTPYQPADWSARLDYLATVRFIAP